MLAGLSALKEKQGVLLLQLPAQFLANVERLEEFLAAVPNSFRLPIEFRHTSWNAEATFAVLEHYRTAYCVMSGAGLPCILRATTDFVYVRLHGPDHFHLYGGSYSDEDLHWWKDRINEWQAQLRDVFVYFNNDGYSNAVRNALRLRELTGY